MEKGLIHLYCGDGKGKSTAAMGLCLRALGAGKKVVLAQFLKDGSSSELVPLAKLGAEILPCPSAKKFVFQMNNEEKQSLREESLGLFQKAVGLPCDLLVLDEACGAVGTGILPEDVLLDFLKNKADGQEVVLTGRDPSPQLLALADYVSEVCKRKHPYDQGIPARRGIEF